MILYESYQHRLTQMRYLRVAVAKITAPAFRPDGLDLTGVEARIAEYNGTLTALYDAAQDAGAARGALATLTAEGHATATAVYACMKSCYRTRKDCLGRIKGITKNDSSPTATLARMKRTARCWAKLPDVPGTSGPMVTGTETLAVFETRLKALDGAITALTDAGSDEAAAVVVMRELDAATENFVGAALAQGRTHYAEGTANRAYIDEVPTTPSAQKPEQATFILAESPAGGVVHLIFDADHATSFEVWRKGPGEAQFALAADVLRPGDWLGTGLAGGTHEFKVVGVNSRGKGPPSEIATLSVPAVAVA